MADTKNVSEETSMDAASQEQQNESIEEMLAHHRQEIKQLQNKETEMKKAAAKGSKAEQKAKKKQVEEDISKLSTKLKEKQLKELATHGFSSGNTSNNVAKEEMKEKKEDIETLVRAIAGVAVTEQQHAKQPSKSVKRREKRFKEEAEREQRIKEEQSKLKTEGTDRMMEYEKLEKKLKPLGLTIHEIKPDGHCLYRAVENQLGGSYSYQKLREMASTYMREHKSDFIPFLLSENEGGGSKSDSVEERFEKYCREVESTAAWGGQLEIEALTHCLKKHIMVFSGSFPDVEMGKEYKSGNGSVMLSYHRHAFGLGEHYNSVVLLHNDITG